jgi:hypothetical protein
MNRRLALLLLPIVCAAACGKDDDPKKACDQLVESFSSAWARCGRSTYEAAKQQFSSQFD